LAAGAWFWSPSRSLEFTVTRRQPLDQGEAGAWGPSSKQRGIVAGRMTALAWDRTGGAPFASVAGYWHSASQCSPRHRRQVGRVPTSPIRQREQVNATAGVETSSPISAGVWLQPRHRISERLRREHSASGLETDRRGSLLNAEVEGDER